ncbi:hypothetical protein PENSPDRAFT_692647 [Peniophora sp. CONT]|nr:hypothetical protein PENSPDRAFT_692647 [Peniophora sp. CONT]
MVNTPLAIVKDTGVPSGTQSTHKVLVLFHGLAFQSNVFTHLLPFAQAHNARIILVNRREYPGSEPLSQEERDVLNTAQGDGALAANAAKRLFAARADEILSLLEDIVEKGDVPRRSIILVGWSLAAFYMTSILARPPTTVGRVDLGQYMRRVICYDTSHALLGFPQPAPNMFNPFADPSIAPQDIGAAFMSYITGYYSHTIPHTPGLRASNIVDGLEQRIPKKNTSFTPEELSSVVFGPPADVPTGGADILHFLAAQKHELFAMTLGAALRGERWPHVELREVWGDASFWEGCVAGVEFGRLVHENKQAPKGEIGRPANAVRWIGTNHFAHWDYPERTLLGLLEDGVEDWTVVSS